MQLLNKLTSCKNVTYRNIKYWLNGLSHVDAKKHQLLLFSFKVG